MLLQSVPERLSFDTGIHGITGGDGDVHEADFYHPSGTNRSPRSVPHLLVFIPGIGGSALKTADEKLIWGLSGKLLNNAVRLPELLAGPSSRLADPDYDDGVRPCGLMAVSIPGLTRKLGAYESVRATLTANFALTEHNYLEFGYDWRRPVALSSALLATAINEKLPALRRRRPGARVIIVAHSMGGLVARHYLQEHDRAGDCERVLTLGTPYRGSVKALDYLINGPRLGPLRFRFLAETMRRVPALYELLPIYRTVIDRRGALPAPAQRVVEIVEALGLDPEHVEQVRAAREFMRALNAPNDRSRRLQPLVGYGSPTPQQAELYDGKLIVSERADLLPAEYQISGGDGTVPAGSARPAGARGVTVRYADQSHMGMVTGSSALTGLWYMVHAALDDLEADDPMLGPDREEGHDPGVPRRGPALCVRVADYYAAGEPIRISGHARAWAPGRPLWARLDPAGRAVRVDVAGNGEFTVDLDPLPEALYRLALTDLPDGPALFSDVVEVA